MNLILMQNQDLAISRFCLCASSVCAAHCRRCDAVDRGPDKCNDGACDAGYIIDSKAKTCIPGEGVLIQFLMTCCSLTHTGSSDADNCSLSLLTMCITLPIVD